MTLTEAEERIRAVKGLLHAKVSCPRRWSDNRCIAHLSLEMQAEGSDKEAALRALVAAVEEG